MYLKNIHFKKKNKEQEYQKQNIGKEMFQFIEQISKSRNKVFLKTYSWQTEGQLFREKMWFQFNHNIKEEERKAGFVIFIQ